MEITSFYQLVLHAIFKLAQLLPRNNASLTDGHKCCYSGETKMCISFEDLGNILIQGMSKQKSEPDFLLSYKGVKVYKRKTEFLLFTVLISEDENFCSFIDNHQ